MQYLVASTAARRRLKTGKNMQHMKTHFLKFVADQPISLPSRREPDPADHGIHPMELSPSHSDF